MTLSHAPVPGTRAGVIPGPLDGQPSRTPGSDCRDSVTTIVPSGDQSVPRETTRPAWRSWRDIHPSMTNATIAPAVATA